MTSKSFASVCVLIGSIRPRVSTHPRVSKFPIRKRSLMEIIRQRKRKWHGKWDTLGGGHSWDGTSYVLRELYLAMLLAIPIEFFCVLITC